MPRPGWLPRSVPHEHDLNRRIAPRRARPMARGPGVARPNPSGEKEIHQPPLVGRRGGESRRRRVTRGDRSAWDCNRRSEAIGRSLLAHAASFEFFTRSAGAGVVSPHLFSNVTDGLVLLL